MSSMAEFNKNADEPIIDTKSDKFGRADFARGLAEALVKVPDSQSFTVGLHGAWGSGKTSIIKMAEEYLDKQYKDDVIVISFNPWIFSNTESLHVALFGALAQRLGKRLNKDIAVDLRKYAELTGAAGTVIAPFFPPAPILARILSGGMTALSGEKAAVSAESIKLRVDKMLKESDRRVIVVIDDIDRLDSDEIHLVFKLVKNVARFSNISYLLAFDQTVVAKALAGRYPDEPEIGGNFVEKIVQLSLFVPPVDREVLGQFMLESIDAIAEKHKLTISDEEVSRFQSAYSNLLSELFSTPRKAVRYLNAIDFTFERLANEANFTDVMLVEALRIFEPELYARVSTKKDVLIDRAHYSRNADNEKEAAKVEIFGNAQPKVWPASVIRELFTSYEWALGGSSYTGDFIKQWDEEQRVCSDKYFDRYFNYGVPIGDVPDAKLRDFLELLTKPKTTQDEANKVLKKLIKGGHPNVLISKLRNKEDDLPKEICEKLAPALVSIGADFPRTQQSFMGDTFSSYVQSAILAVHLTRRVGDTFSMLKALMNDASLDYAEQLLRWIRASTENDKRDESFIPLITEQQLDTLGKALANRIKQYAHDGDLIKDFSNNLPALMWVWNKWGSPQAIKAYLGKAFIAKGQNAITFLDSYVGHAYDMLSGRKSRSEFRREAYNEIAKFADPEIFVKPLASLYGNDFDANVTEFPLSRVNKGEPFEKLVAKQFLYIHHTTQKEAKTQ